MDHDTKALEDEVEQLLEQFSLKNKQTYKCNMDKIKESLSGRRKLMDKELEVTFLRNMNLDECQDDICESCAGKIHSY